MGFLTLVDGMPLTPHVCSICASNPVDEAGDRRQRQAIFAEGVDIDFGNSLYICMDCANIIADLIDRVPQEGYDKLMKEAQDWKSLYEELKVEHEEVKEIVDQIRNGAAAAKKLKARSAA